MENGILSFDPDVLFFEQHNLWKSATDLVYQHWQAAPNDINLLLCAGTEIWYALLEIEYETNSPLPNNLPEIWDSNLLQSRLWEIAEHGQLHFASNSDYNAYFGYMYQVMPYFFLGYNGDYDGFRKLGQHMMRKAAFLETKNLFAAAMAHEMDEDNSQYNKLCKAFWSAVSPHQWGVSNVQKYFYYILNGQLYAHEIGIANDIV